MTPMPTFRSDTFRQLKRRLGRNPLVFHGYQFTFRALFNPANRGRRLSSCKNYLAWYLIDKPRGRSRQVTLPNSMRSLVYPDSDSGVSYIFDGDVDQLETDFIRSTLVQGDFIVDAGCNVGNRCLALADIIGGALLIDANPNCLERVRENLQLNKLDTGNFHLLHSAIGSANTTVEFAADSGTSCQSAIASSESATETITVPMVTLDSALQQIGKPPVTFLKTDLEGYDLDAFAGALELLSSDSLRLVFFERWPSIPLDQFIDFFAGIYWEVFSVSSEGEICSDRDLLLRRNNLFARPCASQPSQ